MFRAKTTAFGLLLTGALLSSAPALAETDDSSALAPSVGSPDDGIENRLTVRLELKETELSERKVVAALEDEFQLPVQTSVDEGAFVIEIRDRALNVTVVDDEGVAVRRQITLPTLEARQLDAIALLAGNLARDAGGSALAELLAQAPPREVAPPPIPPPLPSSDEEDAPPPDKTEDKEGPSSKADDSADGREISDELETIDWSVAFAGKMTFPHDLDKKRNRFHLGLVHSDLGAIEGLGLTMLVAQNRGLHSAQDERDWQGEGALLAGIWSESRGSFRGALGGGLVSLSAGGALEGAQGAGLFAWKEGALEGAQVAGLVAVGRGPIEGAQIAGSVALSQGNLEGAQLAGAGSGLDGDLRGAQMAGAFSATTGHMRGAQLAGAATYAGELEGLQLAPINVSGSLSGVQAGIINLAYRRFDGTQFGLLNISGDFEGSQIGLLNIGRRGQGTQVGLLNIARDLDGATVAPVAFIPGIHHQLITYVSYTTPEDRAGLPAGPLTHIGLKFIPGHVYSQIALGLGKEAEDCSIEADDCQGGGVEYAPSFAFGVHVPWGRWVFAEADMMYQFEKAFDDQIALRHSAQGRIAAGLQLTPAVALLAGGGPRVNFRQGPDTSTGPEVSVFPHAFAGMQFF